MIQRDFTLKKYEELCKAIIKSGAKTFRVKDYLTKKGQKTGFILRHDVDRKPESALDMAKLEQDLGVSSTYYFRMVKGVFLPHIVHGIESLGHEIGYHYEVLDKAKGDHEKAIEIFEEELKELRKIAAVETICMHGSPLPSWSNKDLWRAYDFKDFGIIGEPYLSIDYTQLPYLTDTGRSWDGRYSVKDVVESGFSMDFHTTNDVIRAIDTLELGGGLLLTHPNRWSSKPVDWLVELVLQRSKNLVKKGIIYYRSKNNHVS